MSPLSSYLPDSVGLPTERGTEICEEAAPGLGTDGDGTIRLAEMVLCTLSLGHPSKDNKGGAGHCGPPPSTKTKTLNIKIV